MRVDVAVGVGGACMKTVEGDVAGCCMGANGDREGSEKLPSSSGFAFSWLAPQLGHWHGSLH